MSRQPSPTAEASSRVAPSLVLLVACLGAFLAFLDATVVNVAFPSISESFTKASIGGLSWILNAYNIVFAACLIVFGRITDLVGRRRAFVAGTFVFTVASGLCGIAPNLEFLVALRVLQGFGAALLVPASLALVISAFPAQRRAHAIGLWGASAAVAAGLGPPVGGLLVELGGWRWAFLVNVPIGLATIVAAHRGLDESRAPGRRRMPDLRGAALLAVGLAVLNLGVVKGQDWGWTSAAVLGCFLASAVLTALFVVSSRSHREPLLDPALLRLRAFSVSTLATVFAGFGFFAYMLTNILWLQFVWGYNVVEAGLALVPGALVAAVVAGALGPFAERHGYRVVIVPGALIWAAAYLWYVREVGVTPAFLTQWLPGQVLSGIGVGATLPLLGSAGLASVPGGRYATASAISSSARQLGGVLGIAVLVVVLDNPTGATMVTALRHGWVLSIGAFVVTAGVSTLLGRALSVVEEPAHQGRPARILEPTPPPSWEPVPAGRPRPVPLVWGTLPEDARRRLEESLLPVRVAAGQYLLHQGDAPGSAYSIQTGRFEVEVDGHVVRELGPGDIVGELALLTGEPRSASIRARRDSSVLELRRAAFDDLTTTDARASRALLEQMAGRLRSVGSVPEPRPPDRSTVVSVVALTPDAPVVEVARVLAAQVGVHRSTISFTSCEPAGLERAEQDYDKVLLVGDGGASPGWRDFCLRQADVVVLVARVDDRATTLPLEPVPGRQPELVLLGPDRGPAERTAWQAQTDAWDLTLCPGSLTTGLRVLGNRLAGVSVGIVLGGGGARGLVHVGVLRELSDCGVQVDRIAGSSIGAVIAAAHARGLDGAELEAAAYSTFVRGRNLSDFTLPAHSLISGNRMRAASTRIYGEDSVIEGLPRQLWMVSTDLLSRTRRVHRRGRLVDAVLASSRIPGLFPPIPTEDGRLLVDGGVLDNLPVDLLVQRDEGPVVAVNVGGGSATRRAGKPAVPALGDTLLRAMMINSAGAVQTARSRGAWVVSPSAEGVGFLEFHQMDVLVEAGRAAARALLERCDGDLGALGQAPEVALRVDHRHDESAHVVPAVF